MNLNIKTNRKRWLFSERHKEQEKRMETIVRESRPVELGDEVVKASEEKDDFFFIHLFLY